eukprot:761778_1
MALHPPPVLTLSESENEMSAAAADEPHSGDEIMFEGQHFHYLDSFVVPPPLAAPSQPHAFTLGPRRKYGSIGTSDVSSHSSLFHLPSSSSTAYYSGHSESSLSIAQSLREPILTPSSSSSSLDKIFKQQLDEDVTAVDINPDKIFSDDDGYEYDDGDWGIGSGDDADIDAEFESLAR